MAGPGADLARDVRKFVFDSFLEHSIPPVLEEIMERFRPAMRKFYYDASKYDTYLDQLGVKFPTLAKAR